MLQQQTFFDLFNMTGEEKKATREAPQTVRSDYDSLVERMNYYGSLYYDEDNPEITDEEWDDMTKKLKKMEKDHPDWLRTDSPTQKVGGNVKRKAVAVEHNVPMLSIDDLFSYEEVSAWVAKVKNRFPEATFSVEQKYDGLSCTLRYEWDDNDGCLVLKMAETRGNGYVGEDVTLCVYEIPDVPRKIYLSYDYLELRGEVYMSKEDFEAYNRMQGAQGKTLAANPRNLAAGTLRALNPKVVRERGLHMNIFNVQDVKGSPNAFRDYHVLALDTLQREDIPVSYHKQCTTVDEVLDAITEIGERRNDLPYDIDGAVIKINEIPLRKEFKAEGKNAAGMKAYKYPAEKKEVTLLGVDLSVGRTGRIAPTGITTPVSLCGTTVSRVTLHNLDYIREKHVGIGGRYLIYKSGDIIPKLDSVVGEPEEVFSYPDVCPVCGHRLFKDEEKADYFCVNPSCKAQLVRTVSYFCSRDALDIKSLGETLIEALVEGGYLKSYADVYSLKDYRAELIQRGMLGKEKNTDKILLNIEQSKEKDCASFLTGLGIRNVGKNTAKMLIGHFGSIDKLASADMAELVGLSDIGAVTAKCIHDYFMDEENQELLHRMREYGLPMENKSVAEDDLLAGKVFCITGTLSSMGRKEAEELIEKHGGKSAGFSKSIDYLIAGEKAGSKLEKATAANIPVLTEQDFLGMLKVD